jgi:hypothetical protein
MHGVKVSASKFAARRHEIATTSFASFGCFVACLWGLD